MSGTLGGNRTAATHRETADAIAALARYPRSVLQIAAKGEIKPFNPDGQWLIEAFDNPAANGAAVFLLDLIKGAKKRGKGRIALTPSADQAQQQR